MTDPSIAGVISLCLFVSTVAVGLAGADKPPPLGFLWLVGVLAAACLFAFRRLKRHLGSRREGRLGQTRRIAVEGAAAGLGIAVVLLLMGGRAQEVSVSIVDRAIGLLVFSAAGSVVALVGWLGAAQLQSHFNRSRQSPPV
ncbi:MAG: hypothetical protein HGB10_11555 [Coriobacteriia bacterium]|nr:hypothetical protein [Coriobacteriia bacterium]